MKSFIFSIFVLNLISNCYLKADYLYAWGYNNAGQFGDGTTTDRYKPFLIGTDSNWVKVFCGVYQTAVQNEDSLVWAWGGNLVNQLGKGTKIWTDIALGDGFNLAIKNDSSLWAWGSNSRGQLGDGTTIDKTLPVQILPGSKWLEVSCGLWFTVALKSDGTIWTWGYNSSGQLGDGTTSIGRKSPYKIGNDTNWSKIFCGLSFIIAIKKNGSLWSWGENGMGQLGYISKDEPIQTTPLQIGSDSNWVQASCGQYHTVAIKNDGTLWSWGLNNSGQLGDGKVSGGGSKPTKIGLENNWFQVACGYIYTIAIKKDGTLWAWGNNNYGNLGDGTKTLLMSPTQIGNSSSWTQVACGLAHTIALNKTYLTSVPEISPSNNSISLNIKPNPANEVIEIEFLTPIIENSEICIYSIDGNIVDKIQNLTGNSTIYNTSKLAVGEYSVVMTCGKEKATRKLVVVR